MFSIDSYKLILDNISDGVYVVDARRVISYWNKGAERLTGFTAADVMGKSCCDYLLTHIDAQGRSLCEAACPAAQCLKDGQTRQAQLYLHHKDGYRVPIRASVSPVRDEAGKIIGTVEVFNDDSALRGAKAALESLKKWAINDLTSGLPNRRYVEARLQSRVEEMRRFGWPFGVFIAEIDHFREIQTNGGQALTDRVLKMVGASVLNATRSLDTVGRWDPQQFLGIVANASADALQAVAERARMLVETSYLNTDTGPRRVTVSIGASAADRGDSADTLLRRAEVCLYHSRSSGRNRVTIHGQA